MNVHFGEGSGPDKGSESEKDPDPKFLIIILMIGNTGFKSVSDPDLRSVWSGEFEY